MALLDGRMRSRPEGSRGEPARRRRGGAISWAGPESLEGRLLLATTGSVTVPGTADVFEAGFPSPVPNYGTLPVPITLPSGRTSVVTLASASGGVSVGTNLPTNGPDGGPNLKPTSIGNSNGNTNPGISGIVSDRTMFLVGVFLPAGPLGSTPPAALDFSGNRLDDVDISPQLGQTFAIGDGLTVAGAAQRFHAPQGAAQLYLGFADAWNLTSIGGPPGQNNAYNDNTGQLSVPYSIATDPSVTLSTSKNPASAADLLRFTATLDNPPPGVASGFVSFSIDGNDFEQEGLVGNVATLPLSHLNYPLAPGPHLIRATYIDSSDIQVASNVVTQTITSNYGAATGGFIAGPATAPITSASLASVIYATNSARPGDFTASIDWGDGQATPGTVAILPGDGTLGTVVVQVGGTHTYAQPGDRTARITITDKLNATQVVDAGVHITASPLALGATPFSATQGEVFSGAVAQFSDLNPPSDPGLFRVTIDWGDGSSSPGTASKLSEVTLPGVGPATNYTVLGTHTYLEAGTRRPVVTVLEPFGATATATGQATVVPAAVPPVIPPAEETLTAGPVPLSPALNVPFDGRVASFRSSDASAVPGDFSATISWAGEPGSPASVIQPGGPGTDFYVTGSHTYASAGQFPVVAAVTSRRSGKSAASSQTAFVGKASLVPTAKPITAAKGESFTLPVATFTDTNPAAQRGDFTATIDWDDPGSDQPTSTGSVDRPDGAGPGFVVTGSHAYAAAGPRDVKVTIADDTGARVVQRVAIGVSPSRLVVTPAPIAPYQYRGFVTKLAEFTTSNPRAQAGDFTATIHWGDNSPDSIVPAVAPAVAGQPFTVNGSHTYLAPGDTPAHVTIAEKGGGTGDASVPVHVAAGDVTVADDRTPLAVIASSNALVKVATFTDPFPQANAEGYRATIDWGNKVVSTGTVRATDVPGQFEITGSPPYDVVGTYPVVVTLAVSPDLTRTIARQANVTAGVAPVSPLRLSRYDVAKNAPVHSKVADFLTTDPNEKIADYAIKLLKVDGANVGASNGLFEVVDHQLRVGPGWPRRKPKASMILILQVTEPGGKVLQFRTTIRTTPNIQVTNAGGGDGPGTLANAIEQANLSPGSTIEFHIQDQAPRPAAASNAPQPPKPAASGTAAPAPTPAPRLFTITPEKPLVLTAPTTTIDGTTQPGWLANASATGDDARIVVRIDGSKLPGQDGLTVRGGNTTIKGLSITGFANAIELEQANGDIVQGNFLGVAPNPWPARGALVPTAATPAGGLNTSITVPGGPGNQAVPALRTDQPPAFGVAWGNSGNGVRLNNIASSRIGGTAPAERNVIANNGGNGIMIGGGGNHVVAGNLIGTVDGMTALGNRYDGIYVVDSQANRIGLDVAPGRPGNVIVANGFAGVHLLANNTQTPRPLGRTLATQQNLPSGDSSGNTVPFYDRKAIPADAPEPDKSTAIGKATTANKILGNAIGVSAVRSIAIGNGHEGILIDGAPGNQVGDGTGAGANFVGGNGKSGVEIQAPKAVGNTIRLNFIGTDLAGNATLGNHENGVEIIYAKGNEIEGNVIAGNALDESVKDPKSPTKKTEDYAEIELEGVVTTTTVQSNTIGSAVPAQNRGQAAKGILSHEEAASRNLDATGAINFAPSLQHEWIGSGNTIRSFSGIKKSDSLEISTELNDKNDPSDDDISYLNAKEASPGHSQGGKANPAGPGKARLAPPRPPRHHD